jgi:hypothetical protein
VGWTTANQSTGSARQVRGGPWVSCGGGCITGAVRRHDAVAGGSMLNKVESGERCHEGVCRNPG